MIIREKKNLPYDLLNADPLILEEWDGKIYYRKGYREVLSGSKKIEDIMGSSSLQAELVSYIMQVLLLALDLRKYRVHTSEPGIHLAHKVNMSGDILIYDRAVLTPDKISSQYADVPPKIVVEVDIEIEAEGITEVGYVFQKSEKLLGFGVEKVIWVLSDIQKVVVFEPNQEAKIINWHGDIEILDSVSFNVGKHLDDEGIVLEK
ncbi:Uma2 family endonuclease [Dyadobacter arcticus]|uniref:Uma2 family endonuclease n=1 Tax=Dyadobacter arcticus TaxID=1078754 RepID=A0ABX0URG0_9BACT|nr:Uma2 family endonuclease [Dyadobacter arcticus]NIJ55586.1 Uma2 family endonuclease [Dyadobacter arcticus]